MHKCASNVPRRGLPVERCAQRISEFLAFLDRLIEHLQTYDNQRREALNKADSKTPMNVNDDEIHNHLSPVS